MFIYCINLKVFLFLVVLLTAEFTVLIRCSAILSVIVKISLRRLLDNSIAKNKSPKPSEPCHVHSPVTLVVVMISSAIQYSNINYN